MIDTHCHLDSERFDADRPVVLARAWAAGVEAIVVPAVGPLPGARSWEALLELPASDPRLHVALGIHPQLLPELPGQHDAAHLATLDQLLARGTAVAVGECGLDGPTAQAEPASAPMERQLAVLRGHFELARRHHLPLLVHCLRAQPALVALLEEEPPLERPIVLHSYSGGADLVRFYARKGCYFSLAGPVTFAEARRPLEIARAIPLERLLVETDAPDQAPHPFRGQRCEPAYLPTIVAAIARARGMAEPDVAAAVTENARRLFSLSSP